MMGTKARIFAPIAVVSLEELVPSNHFYRHLDHVLDLSFVRDLVKETYAHGGRPSIDPVVFFKLQLVMFFEDIRSERLLMQLVADKLSVRWYVGYNLDEPLPDHSSLTRIRERYGVEVFRRFFEAIVEQCQAAGLVWGKELYFDGTKVEANASLDSLKPRFFVEAHLADLFRAQTEALPEKTDQQRLQTEAVSTEPVEQEEIVLPTHLPVLLSQEEYQELAQHNEERHDWIEEVGAQDRRVKGRCYQATEPYKKALRKRSVWVEPLFAEGKDWHGMRRLRLRELERVNCEALMRAAGQNLKRLLKKRGGWHRPGPAAALFAYFLAAFGCFASTLCRNGLFSSGVGQVTKKSCNTRHLSLLMGF